MHRLVFGAAVALFSISLLAAPADAVGSKMAGGGSGDGGANNQPTDPGGNDTVGNVLGNFWGGGGGGGGGCIKLINCKEIEERANLNPRHHVHHWWDDLDAALKAIFHGKTTSKPK